MFLYPVQKFTPYWTKEGQNKSFSSTLSPTLFLSHKIYTRVSSTVRLIKMMSALYRMSANRGILKDFYVIEFLHLIYKVPRKIVQIFAQIMMCSS